MLPLTSRSRKPALRRETQYLRLADGSQREVLRVHDPRARRMRLTVSEGRVRLTVPRWASARDAEAFLRENRGWISGKLAEFDARRARLKPLRFGHPGPLPLRGGEVPVHWLPGVFARADLVPERGIVVSAPATAGPGALGAALGAMLESEARRDLGQWLPRYLPTLPRAPLSVKLRPLQSLWGSLSVNDGLSLDLSLVLGPPAAFEYVLVHELCHLIHGDHSPRFWRAVEQRFPEWRVQRDYLRGAGLELKGTLRWMLGG